MQVVKNPVSLFTLWMERIIYAFFFSGSMHQKFNTIISFQRNLEFIKFARGTKNIQRHNPSDIDEKERQPILAVR